MEQKTIYVERETFESKKSGKKGYAYFIRGNVRGVDVKAGVVPPDVGGYTVLDIVFGGAMQAELVLKPYEIKDDATGNVIAGNTYYVRSVDDDGLVYECQVKPARKSDKNLMDMLLR